MTIRDFAIVAGYDTIIKVYGPGKNEAITAFQSQFWDTIDASVLGLVIKDITISKENRRTAVIETISGRPFPVRTFQELKDAMSDPLIPDIKLFADIYSDEYYAVFLEGEGIAKTLDLNGHILSFNGLEEKTNDDSITVFVTQGAQLVIYDSAPNEIPGSVIAARDNGDMSFNIAVEASAGATVNIYGGNFYAYNSPGADRSYTVFANGAFINIFGGRFDNGTWDGEGGTAQVLAHIPGEIDGALTCRGGLYAEQDPEDYAEEGCETWTLLTHEADGVEYFTVLPHQTF